MNNRETRAANPFGAPVHHLAETSSTMADAQALAAGGEPDGTVVYADYQSAGRGRVEGRTWESAQAENLLCTVLLRRAPVPGFTLRIGLAISRTFDAFLPDGMRTSIKWPNDVLYGGKKLAGILCENDGTTIYVGTGLNIAQRAFPPELEEKASSLALILDALPPEQKTVPIPERETVLELYLVELKRALESDSWREDIAARLWKRGERVNFLAGDPGRNEFIDGTIEGIGSIGELLFRADSDGEGAAPRRIFSGEFPLG